MTKDEALIMCLEYIEKNAHERKYVRHAIKAAIEVKNEPDYKELWQQMCERCDSLDKKLAQPEQDGECKHCTDGCPACDARKLPEQDWIERERAVGYREGHRAALAQRTWVGLTDEEINLIYSEPQTHIGQYARAIEAKLKDKNI
jgi:hypothetical protein